MVKSFYSFVIAGLILLGACTTNKPQIAPKQTDGKPSQQRAEQLFGELDTGSAAGKGQSQPLANNSIRIMPATKPGELVVVEIDTFRVFNETVSLKEAENQTRNFVRELALDRALPAEITLTSLSTNMYAQRRDSFDESAALGIFMLSSSAGRFVKEEFLRKEPSFAGHNLKYRMHYRAQIMPQERIYNPSTALGVELSETLLQHGQSFRIKVNSNTDGYLYAFDFLSDNSVALFFPTRNQSDNRIKAGQAWEQEATAICDPSKEITIETLYFVFSQDPIAGWENFRSNRSADDLVFSAGEESFTLFQTWLAQSDPSHRVEKMAQIHILK